MRIDATPAKQPKNRIKQAAVAEFAARGFAAVSVKQIAAKAGVNVAMISYYFGGKNQLIEAIILEFFNNIRGEIEEAVVKGASFAANAHHLSCRLIAFFRDNPHHSRLCILGITPQTAQIAELKSQKQGELFAMTRALMLTRTSPGPVSPQMVDILASAFVGLVFSHLLMEPSVNNALQAYCDDAYFDEYARAIPKLFLGGIEALLDQPEKMARQ